jgi:hypothetical protein
MPANSVSSRSSSVIEVVDHPQGQLDRLAGHRGELDPGQPGPPVGGEQLGTVGQAWWNKMAWMRCCQPVYSPTRARRSQT